MKTDLAPPLKTFRKDYQKPDYLVRHVALNFELDATRTIIRARLEIERNHGVAEDAALVLDGEKLELISLSLDKELVEKSAYRLSETHLTIADVPAKFTLETEVAINPSSNTVLMGLYMSNGMICTQCEAEGFRRITFFPDRPDVLATYEVRIEADEKLFPILLANGNPGKTGALGNGRHFAEWVDPHPKPCYLFALVAGDLASKTDSFTTMSGRNVSLKIFVQPHNIEKVDYGLDALKRSMKWDEEVFGREYDLDIFMIVAVDHFNFGAMENKGLNIFNSSAILANEKTATDADFETIESIVAHEYFHNWSGNRVTCRDWFQLCLKEGFTVYRDQEFSADMRERGVQRIKDVRQLWARQFPEDAGPLAHPVRPDHFITIDNFYTATIYEKGAELVRMLKTLLGEKKFRAATDRYFADNDGTAATVDDFIVAMQKEGAVDLTQFQHWYSDAGTPTVSVQEIWDNGTLTVSLEQHTKPTPGQALKPARHIPLALALIDADGGVRDEQIFNLTKLKEEIRFEGLQEQPVVSVNRGFAAPIHIDQHVTPDQRAHIIHHETDGFNRWSSAWSLQIDILRHLANDKQMENVEAAIASYSRAMAGILTDETLDPAFRAEMLKVPTTADIARNVDIIDPSAITTARKYLRHALLNEMRDDLHGLYKASQHKGAFSPDAKQAGERALKNGCLALAMADDSDEAAAMCLAQLETATNMTDEASATMLIALSARPEKQQVMENFYNKWQSDTLVVNKWLAWQGIGGTAAEISALMQHEAYDIKNPNKVRGLIGVFAMENLGEFHAADGAGYGLFFALLETLDGINPQVAARLLGAVDNWRRLEPTRREKIDQHLQNLASRSGLSENVFEMATRLTENPA